MQSLREFFFENWIRFDEVTAMALVFPFKKNSLASLILEPKMKQHVD